METLDPRVKLLVAVELAVWIGLLPPGREPFLGLIAVGMLAIGATAAIPPTVILTRAAAALPFVVVPGLLGLVAGSFDPVSVARMAARGYTAAMVATLLIGVAPFASLLAAASALGAPDLLVQTTALVYRYLLLLRERGAAMMQTAWARGYGSRTPGRVGVAGAMLGALLLRCLDRAERVHQSMLARGYTGRFPAAHTLSMRRADWLVAGALTLGLGTSLVWCG